MASVARHLHLPSNELRLFFDNGVEISEDHLLDSNAVILLQRRPEECAKFLEACSGPHHKRPRLKDWGHLVRGDAECVSRAVSFDGMQLQFIRIG